MSGIILDSIEYSVSSSGKRYQLKTVRQTSNDVLNEQKSETKYLNYDSWGNPTSVQSKVGSLADLKTVTYGKYGCWCPAQPTCMFTSRTLITTTNTYAPATGLLQNIVRNGETTSYHYDSKNRVDSIGIAGKHAQSFMYDNLDRVTKHTEYLNGKSFS